MSDVDSQISGAIGRSATRLDALPTSGWHRRITVLVGIGSFFDLYEIFLGGVLAAVLSSKWNLDSTGKSLVISAGFIGMFIGAGTMSLLADRIGRRNVLLINLAAYSLLSVATAFSPNLTVFVVLRILCGIGIGSELVLVDTYLAELLPGRIRGRYISWAYVIGFLGVPAAALIGARTVAVQHILGLDGWRWLLIAGGLGALLVLILRRTLPASPRWLESQGRWVEADRIVTDLERRSGVVASPPNPTSSSTSPPQPADTSDRITADARAGSSTAPNQRLGMRAAVASLFGPSLRRSTIMMAVFNFLQTVGYYGFGTLAPLVLIAKGFTITTSLGYSALAFCGYPIGALVAVWLVERVERKYLIIVTALLIAAFGVVFGLATNTSVIVAAGFLLTVSSNVFSSAFHVYQAELFPTRVRSTAVGICYSLSRLTSAVLPFVAVAALAHFHAGVIFIAAAVIMVLVCVDIAVLGPRTNGRSLDQDGPASRS